MSSMVKSLGVGAMALFVWAGAVKADVVTVGNHSFETVGSLTATGWYRLPSGGSWTDGDATNNYDIYTVGGSNFATGTAPDGTRVLNLNAASPISQNLSYSISVGDTITLGFYIGRSANIAQLPGSLKAYFTIGGTDAYTETFLNTASQGAFVFKEMDWTATTSGTLGIKFERVDGTPYIDNVSVSVIPEPASGLMLLGSMLGIGLLRKKIRG